MNEETGPILKLTNVSKRYQATGGTRPVSVLEGVNFEAGRGESLAIIGPSGSGKSTLLHILGTLDRPTSGEVQVAGREVGGLNEADLAALRNETIGFVFQSHFLLPQCTVLENVLVPTLAQPRGKGRSRERPEAAGGVAEPPAQRARRLLERVGLAERLSHWPGQLSGGERQRVAVVRALINRPGILLADEPTGALDQASAASLGELLAGLNREEGVTLVVVTHSLDLARRMGRAFGLSGGRLEPTDPGL